jgi:hypothetical protein
MGRGRGLCISASVALVATAVVLAILGGGEDSSSPEAAAPRVVAADELIEFEETLGHPLYWVGERPGETLELSEEADGSVYLRYLPEGAEAGDPRQKFLTIGTYPVPDAEGALRRIAKGQGVELERLEDGSFALANPSAPGSVYLAHPGEDLEVEVYHPEAGRAMDLVRSGAIERVGE